MERTVKHNGKIYSKGLKLDKGEKVYQTFLDKGYLTDNKEAHDESATVQDAPKSGGKIAKNSKKAATKKVDSKKEDNGDIVG